MLKDFYDIDSEPIVNLETFYGPKKHLIDKCLIIFSKEIFDQIFKEYDCKQIAKLTGCDGGSFVYSFDYGGGPIGFYLSPLGSGLAGGTVSEVNHITGATKFVMFGSCGSLDGNATRGKFIIPTEAYRGEGLSYYFAPASDYIKIKNADVLERIFADLHIPFVKGRVWTTESMLRETVNLVNQRKSEGCIGVEMELAGVQAVCDFYKFELYDFLASGDVLDEKQYDISDLRNANNDFDKFKIARAICLEI